MSNLGKEMVAVLESLTAVQREGVRRSFQAPNLGPEDQRTLWQEIQPALINDRGADDTSLVDLRAALECMPLKVWAIINNCLFYLYRGNVFDEAFTALDTGGIEFHWRGSRYEDFLGLVEAERDRLGIEHPAVLDVGCWQGTLMCELLQRGFYAGGVEVGEQMEEVVRGRVAMLKDEDARRFVGFWSGAAHDTLSRFEGLWHIITCQETLEHVPQAVLQETCDAILGVAKHTVLITVPGWDDGWPAHLRVYTSDDFRRLFHADRNEVTILQEPGSQVYTTVRVRKDVV